MRADRKEMQTYMSLDLSFVWLPFLFLGMASVTYLISGDFWLVELVVLWDFLVALGLAAACAESSIKAALFFAKMERNGMLQEISEDFSEAFVLFSDKARIGARWFYKKGYGTPVRYSDIERVCIRTEGRGNSGERLSIRAHMRSGKDRMLLMLPERAPREHAFMIVSMIAERDLRIQIGDKKETDEAE
ncbi:MAG: hypothetical protein J6K32_12630 [Clostridia bacterium]|nr:hypothetical protein [Clostridia bacterium]